MNIEFYDKLTAVTDESRVYRDEPMKQHITFRVGGNADYFVLPKTKEEVKSVIQLCREMEMPYAVIGNGSNLLVGDKGYRGVILQIGREMKEIQTEGNCIKAQAGALLSQIGNTALREGLAGFEFASGIPGTIGGAVVMNAGAYGGEMKDVIADVTVLTPEGELLRLSKEELELGYRTSIVAKKSYIVLEVTIQLQQGEKETIKSKMNELRDRRIEKQPLEFPSAGSTFKRPEGHFAGKLIADAGLGGFQIGGAQVSEKHCGFIVNRGDATAADIVELMRQVSEKVQETFGVELEPEVKKLGEF